LTSSSSITPRRVLATRGVLVRTTMPSRTGVLQAMELRAALTRLDMRQDRRPTASG
jgi:hypothetical protein